MGLEKFNIKVSTWIRTQPVAPPVRLSELMTRPLLSVPPPPVRRRRHPPFGAMAWLLIIGTILSLCHISPAGAFSPLHPLRLPLRLKSFQLHVPLQTKTLRQNKPAALDSFHTYSTTTIGLLYSKYPPPFSLDHSPVSFSHIAGCSHLTSPRTPSPSHHRNHQRAALKFPRYMPQWRVLYIPAESDRHTDNPLQPSPLMP